MTFKKATAAIAALMLGASPVLAQSAAVRPGIVPIKASAVAAKPDLFAPAPAADTIEDASSLAGTNVALGVTVGLAIIGLIVYIAIEASEDDDSTSP